MQHNEAAHLARRAEAATILAQRASPPKAVQAHCALASADLDRLYAEPARSPEDRQAI